MSGVPWERLDGGVPGMLPLVGESTPGGALRDRVGVGVGRGWVRVWAYGLVVAGATVLRRGQAVVSAVGARAQ